MSRSTIFLIHFDYIYLGKEIKYRLPVNLWYPFEINDFFRYGVAQIQTLHCHYLAALMFLATDCFLFTLLIMLVMLFTSVSTMLENMIITGGEKDLIKLNKLIAVHQKVLDMADLNSKVFSVTALVNFLSSTGMICLSFFQVTVNTLSPNDLFRYFCFFSQQILQVGITCYLGEMLMDSVSQPLPSVYKKERIKYIFRASKLQTLLTVKIGCQLLLLTRRL